MSSSGIKRFKVSHEDDEVVLEVSYAVLTPELAADINSFWGGMEDRLAAEDGDVQRAVVRLFGIRTIEFMQREGWADVYEGHLDLRRTLLENVIEHQVEGWPDCDQLGIQIIEAMVAAPTFRDYVLKEVKTP